MLRWFLASFPSGLTPLGFSPGVGKACVGWVLGNHEVAGNWATLSDWGRGTGFCHPVDKNSVLICKRLTLTNPVKYSKGGEVKNYLQEVARRAFYSPEYCVSQRPHNKTRRGRTRAGHLGLVG